jgi:hypothetical protein
MVKHNGGCHGGLVEKGVYKGAILANAARGCTSFINNVYEGVFKKFPD